MKAYGVKRNWTEVEDCIESNKNHPENHTKIKKIKHRSARRVIRYILHLLTLGVIDMEDF